MTKVELQITDKNEVGRKGALSDTSAPVYVAKKFSRFFKCNKGSIEYFLYFSIHRTKIEESICLNRGCLKTRSLVV